MAFLLRARGAASFGQRLQQSKRDKLLQATQRMQQAQAAYDVARERSSEALRARDWPAARARLSEQIDDHGGARNAQLLTSRSYTLLKLGHVAEALADADRALELEPGSAKAHYRRATALVRCEGRKTEAGDALLLSLDATGLSGPSSESLGADQPDLDPFNEPSADEPGGGVPPPAPHGATEPQTAVRLFGNVLGQIRRDRAYWQQEAPNEPTPVTPRAARTRRGGHGHGSNGSDSEVEGDAGGTEGGARAWN